MLEFWWRGKQIFMYLQIHWFKQIYSNYLILIESLASKLRCYMSGLIFREDLIYGNSVRMGVGLFFEHGLIREKSESLLWLFWFICLNQTIVSIRTTTIKINVGSVKLQLPRPNENKPHKYSYKSDRLYNQYTICEWL